MLHCALDLACPAALPAESSLANEPEKVHLVGTPGVEFGKFEEKVTLSAGAPMIRGQNPAEASKVLHVGSSLDREQEAHCADILFPSIRHNEPLKL